MAHGEVINVSNPAFENEEDVNDDDLSPVSSTLLSSVHEYQPSRISVQKGINNDIEKSLSNGISVPIVPKIDNSNDHRDHAEDDLGDDAQEKQIQIELDDIDIIEQVQLDMIVPPGAAGMIQQTSVRRKRLFFFKMPFYRKSKQPSKPQTRRLKLYEIYKFADIWDIFLMIIGSLAAIAVGACYTLILFLYQRVTDTLVDFGKLQTNATNLSFRLFSSCNSYIIPTTTKADSPHETILSIIKYYILLGFLSIFLYWIAWACWMMAAERQVRRIRYALFRNILRQEIGWFDMHNAGELSNRLIEDLNKIKDGINEKVPDFISLLARVLGTLVYALATGWKLALVFLSISPLVILTFNLTAKIAIFGMVQFIPNIQNFAEALASESYVFEIIERKTKIDASNDEGEKPQIITGDIEFDNVTFTYPARQEVSVLNNLSIKIRSGTMIALVGASGCGKSTILQLIQRFYDPDNGRVLLDGRDIKTLNVAWLRSQIGIVNQEPVLFSGSIEDNIRLGKPDATDDEVQAAAKMANAHGFIMTLPENYKTSSGDKLSGGQKQRGKVNVPNSNSFPRMAIARALISNPKILLLDEATSALDNTTERIVQDALDKAKRGRTTIVIAHRLSTIINADLIIELNHGHMVQCGTHNELMERKDLYYELVIAQTQKEKETDSDSDKEVDEVEKEFVRRRSVNRSFVKQSNASTDDLDDNNNDDDNDDETTTGDPSKEKRKKSFRIPFGLRILKLNASKCPWILLGVICSLIYGTTQPLFELLFAEIYGLFTKSDLREQERLISIYAATIFLIGLAAGMTQFLSSVSFAKSGEELTMHMRKLTFSAMLRQEIGYFDNEANSVGTLLTRLSSDASAIK
ncbi:unnamed protein product, partial [Rotaria sp. Silwood2]